MKFVFIFPPYTKSHKRQMDLRLQLEIYKLRTVVVTKKSKLVERYISCIWSESQVEWNSHGLTLGKLNKFGASQSKTEDTLKETVLDW